MKSSCSTRDVVVSQESAASVDLFELRGSQHHNPTMLREQTSYKRCPPPSHEDIKAVAHMRIADAAILLGVKESKLRILSRATGFPRWPGRKLKAVISQVKGKATGTTNTMMRAVGSYEVKRSGEKGHSASDNTDNADALCIDGEVVYPAQTQPSSCFREDNDLLMLASVACERGHLL